MARIGLTIAGAVAGFLIGGPMGAIQGAALGYGAGAALFPGQLPDQFGPRLDDASIQVSTSGAAIPFGYGTVRTGGNIIWSPGLVEHVATEETGGKGGPTQSTTSYSYTASFAAAFGEGPGTIKKIWGDAKVIYDGAAVDVSTPAAWSSGSNYSIWDVVEHNGSYWQSSAYNQGVEPGVGYQWIWQPFSWTGSPATVKYPPPTLYGGTQAQNPDSTIQTDKGAENTPAFRGLIYAVWEDFALADFGNRIPNIRAEVEYLNADGSSVTTIAQMVKDLCLRSGLEASQVDVAGLPS